MNTSISDISKYKDQNDIEIFLLYRQTNNNVFVSVMIFRYQYLILKIVGQWHRINRNIYLTHTDFEDVLQTAYWAVINCMVRVKEPRTIKNVGSRLKAYIYAALNTEYKHRKREICCDVVDMAAFPDVKMEFKTLPDISRSEFGGIYKCIYHYKYNFYKTGMMVTGTKSRKYMKIKVDRIKKRLKRFVKRSM